MAVPLIVPRRPRARPSLPVITPLCDDPWWNRAAFFTGCCCRAEVIVIGHTYGTTDEGTGSLSRIRPEDGSPMWTVDLGSDTILGTTYKRIPYSVDLDSRGNVYAYWASSQDTAGEQQARGSASSAQGVKKYDALGNLLQSYNLPAQAVFNFSPVYPQHGKVRVDPNDDTRIYVLGTYDTGGNLLHRFDDSLSLQWSIGPATFGATNTRGVGLAVASDGYVWADVQKVWKVDPSSSVVTSSTALTGVGLFLDPSDRVRLPQPESGINTAVAGYASFPTTQFARFHSAFPTPDGAGTWGSGTDFNGSSGYADGANCVFACSNNLPWTPAVGTDLRDVCYLVTDDDGTIVSSGYWTKDTSNGGTIDGIAHNATTNSVFVAGTSADASSDPVIAGKIDPPNNTTEWVAPVFTTPTGSSRGWSIAARTCRL